MYSHSEIFSAMQGLDLAEQVAVMEEIVAEAGIANSADLIANPLLSVMMDLDGGKYPAELVDRVNKLSEAVRMFNANRFAAQ